MGPGHRTGRRDDCSDADLRQAYSAMSLTREALRAALRNLQRYRTRLVWSSRPFLTLAALGTGASAAYWLKNKGIDRPYISVFPRALAHSAHDNSGESEQDSEEQLEDDAKVEEPKLSVMYDFFTDFASLEYQGVPYMTPADFIESLVEDFPRIRKFNSYESELTHAC